jgi:hypothetical protein
VITTCYAALSHVTIIQDLSALNCAASPSRVPCVQPSALRVRSRCGHARPVAARSIAVAYHLRDNDSLCHFCCMQESSLIYFAGTRLGMPLRPARSGRRSVSVFRGNPADSLPARLYLLCYHGVTMPRPDALAARENHP